MHGTKTGEPGTRNTWRSGAGRRRAADDDNRFRKKVSVPHENCQCQWVIRAARRTDGAWSRSRVHIIDTPLLRVPDSVGRDGEKEMDSEKKRRQKDSRVTHQRFYPPVSLPARLFIPKECRNNKKSFARTTGTLTSPVPSCLRAFPRRCTRFFSFNGRERNTPFPQLPAGYVFLPPYKRVLPRCVKHSFPAERTRCESVTKF